MAHVLAIAMQKGGVGKTTTTRDLGTELARAGRRVLLIDLDPQGNLTQSLGFDPTQITQSVYEVLLQPTQGIQGATVQTAYNVDLIPANLILAGAELAVAGRIGRELLLRTALAQARRAYDYILIDCPPSLGVFTVNALAAADAVIVPLQAHVFALKAMPQLEEAVALVQQLNPQLTIGGIVVTMFDKRTGINSAVEDAIREQYGETVFQTVVPFAVKLVESPMMGAPVAVYAPESSAAQAYRSLAAEVMQRYG